jgi:hypothetical protein
MLLVCHASSRPLRPAWATGGDQSCAPTERRQRHFAGLMPKRNRRAGTVVAGLATVYEFAYASHVGKPLLNVGCPCSRTRLGRAYSCARVDARLDVHTGKLAGCESARPTPGTLLALPFGDRQFGAVTCFHVPGPPALDRRRCPRDRGARARCGSCLHPGARPRIGGQLSPGSLPLARLDARRSLDHCQTRG